MTIILKLLPIVAWVEFKVKIRWKSKMRLSRHRWYCGRHRRHVNIEHVNDGLDFRSICWAHQSSVFFSFPSVFTWSDYFRLSIIMSTIIYTHCSSFMRSHDWAHSFSHEREGSNVEMRQFILPTGVNRIPSYRTTCRSNNEKSERRLSCVCFFFLNCAIFMLRNDRFGVLHMCGSVKLYVCVNSVCRLIRAI